MSLYSKTRKGSKNALISYSQQQISSSSANSDSKSMTTKLHSRISENSIVSVQNLQFPESITKKPGVLNVKRQSNFLKYRKLKPNPPPNELCYNFTSSTNSQFGQMFVTVPKKCQSNCSTYSNNAKRRISQSSEVLKSSKLNCQPDKATSEQLSDSNHERSKKRLNFQGAEWRTPCKESFAAGAPSKFMGSCPPNYEQLSKWSKARQKYFLTQDPRKVHCLINPEFLRSKEFSEKKACNLLTDMVKHAQNVCTSTPSEESEDYICDVIDLENPLQLDFQGLDYSKTYQSDEQDFQNRLNYHAANRYMARRKVKAETSERVKEDLHQRMINIPKCFVIRDRNDDGKPVLPKPKIILGKLCRSVDKPHNQKLIKLEKEQRRQRYKDLYLKNKTRKGEQKKFTALQNKIELESLPLTLADDNLKKVLKNIDESIEKNMGKELSLHKTIDERRSYPHTIQETKRFISVMKQKNLIERDKALIAKEFFLERTGKIKKFPAADLEISPPTSVRSVKDYKEASTDDDDDMEVGKLGSKFKLRGFQFKIASNLRGKITERAKLQGSTRREKGCITREEWLEALAPKKQQIKSDVEIGIRKSLKADDPQHVLFAPPYDYKPPQVEHSTIGNYIRKPLGRHYDRIIRKQLKFAKPSRRYSVKKFNLIGYRFGDTAKRFSQIEDSPAKVQIFKLKSTNQFMAAKALKEKRRLDEIKQKRLQLLGIPCKAIKQYHLRTKCENSSSSSDSGWVPQTEPIIEEGKGTEMPEVEKAIRPLHIRGNMPAPKFREPTLRQHPRYSRDYDNLRVPSDMFDQMVLTTNLPHLRKLDKDRIQFANVELKKTAYTDMFEGRHHHDHLDVTQKRQVDVHYNPRLVTPEITKIQEKSERAVMQNFNMANPPCNQFVDMNLSLPQCDFNEMLREHYANTIKTKGEVLNNKKLQKLCIEQDYKVQTRDPKELERLVDYPGRQEYLQLLKDVRQFYEGNKQLNEAGDEKLYVNKAGLLKELEEDLKSIESCLTSLSSSVYTNLSNDSGSFLLMEGKEKIPLDYIRKSIVPFEELHRCRFQAVPIDVDKEQANPFNVLPFSGQRKAQSELTAAKDSFFTFNTRLKNGMRVRLEVPVDDIRKKLLGKGSNKHKCVVATDIDENYIDELKNRPPVKIFKFKTGRSLVKDALRLKFESTLIQGQIVRTKIYDRLNEQHWNDMLKINVLFRKLFSKWEKREYDAAMAVVYTVKNFYDETDRLTTAFKRLERELATLNMDIVFIEAHWVHCIMLQNFHYLLGDIEWRLQHDWIHRVDDSKKRSENQLENFADSIAKRSTLNIRKREKDDAWAIKSYYEQVYLTNKHDNLIVFANALSFLKGLENLKTKTFLLLLEMHFALGIHTEVQYNLESFEDQCLRDFHEKENYVSRKCAKLYFMSDRSKLLSERTSRFLAEPIEECFNDDMFHKNRAVITEAWRRIVPTNTGGGINGHAIYTVDMVAAIFEVVMDLLAKFETVPMDITYQVENKMRARRTYLQKHSYQAYHIERRIDMEMKKVVKNLQPPYQKIKRTSKLPRYYLKKREKPIEVEEKIISERAKFFHRAFNDDELQTETDDVDKDSIIQLDGTQEQLVPFYFDHFLKLNGYTPNYNFKTQIEMRDGLEIDRLQIRSVIPEIQERMEYWETMRKKIMEANIAKNPKIYENVKT